MRPVLLLLQMPSRIDARTSAEIGGNTGGPPIVRSSAPLAAIIASRTISASSRWIAEAPEIADSPDPSRRSPASSNCDDIWYASDVMIRRCICLMLQPRSMNSTASQSSNSGCVGGLAHLAEVVQRGDDAPAEVVAPDAIDDHARGQRILRGAEPFGQRAPASRSAAVRGRNLPPADCRT